jgi:membrane-associated phospholipid phosphatase
MSLLSSTIGDPSYPDTGWYRDITDFARHTHWLNGFFSAYTDYGLVIFPLLVLAAWWFARGEDAVAMAAVLAAGVSVVVATFLNIAIKSGVSEIRPCRAVPGVFLVQPCPPASDYSFPSNHTVVASAATAALVLACRQLGRRWLAWVSVAAMLLMAFSRVYVGAHYPHDVLGSFVVGTVVALLGYRLLLAPLTGLVTRFSETRLRPLLVAAPVSVAAASDPETVLPRS